MSISRQKDVIKMLLQSWIRTNALSVEKQVIYHKTVILPQANLSNSTITNGEKQKNHIIFRESVCLFTRKKRYGGFVSNVLNDGVVEETLSCMP